MTKTTRKEREKLAKRQAILKAARQVFAAKGLHAATLDEIADKAEFAKGTLYCYFKSKEDLFQSMLADEIARFEEELRRVLEERKPVPERIEDIVRTMLHLFQENVDLMRLLTQERPGMPGYQCGIQAEDRLQPAFQRLSDMMASLVREGIRTAGFRKLDPVRAAVAVFNLVHGSALYSFQRRRPIDSPEEVSFLTGMILGGMGRSAVK
jgi:AcrR family transcriptional regulator